MDISSSGRVDGKLAEYEHDLPLKRIDPLK
jgi:hypothetical protein